MSLIDWLTDPTRRVRGFRHDVILSALFVVASGAILGMIIAMKDPGPCLEFLGKALWFLWSLMPPLYFMWEWTSLKGGAKDDRFDDMKYSHELCSKFWLAGVSIISVVLVTKFHDIRLSIS